GGPRWRQQLVDPALLPAPGQLLQHVARVRPRIHVVEPAGSEDRIDDGRTPSALVRTGEEVVLAADSDLPEGSLARVVVGLERVDEVAPCVREASDLDDPRSRIREQTVVSLVGIRLKPALPVYQERCRPLGRPVRRVVEGQPSPIAEIAPDVPSFGTPRGV